MSYKIKHTAYLFDNFWICFEKGQFTDDKKVRNDQLPFLKIY